MHGTRTAGSPAAAPASPATRDQNRSLWQAGGIGSRHWPAGLPDRIHHDELNARRLSRCGTRTGRSGRPEASLPPPFHRPPGC